MNSLLVTFLLFAGLDDKPDLTGRVVTAGSKPVAGAHVMIDSAGVRRERARSARLATPTAERVP